jgi:hypothetical protein
MGICHLVTKSARDGSDRPLYILGPVLLSTDFHCGAADDQKTEYANPRLAQAMADSSGSYSPGTGRTTIAWV